MACTAVLAVTTVLFGGCGFGPPPATAPPTTGSTAGVASRVGMAGGWSILWEDDAARQRELDAIAATGATWFSMDVDWNSIQGNGPNSFQWDVATDRVVREARARGLTILGMLGYSPPWARRPACATTSHCLPQDPATFARFAGAAAARYGTNSTVPDLRDGIAAWQIWNEPNHYPFVQPTVDVAGYTRLLTQAYAAIKAADPGATVVTGGMSPAGDDPAGLDMAPVTFLAGIYANGGGGSFDAVGHHPYSFPYSPLVDTWWNSFQQTRTLHDVLVAHGDGAKKVWATEAGAPTGTDPGMSVTPQVQAQFVADYFQGWFHDFGGFTGPLIWFQVRDSGTNLGFFDDNFGLLARDFTPKPAYGALRQQIANG